MRFSFFFSSTLCCMPLLLMRRINKTNKNYLKKMNEKKKKRTNTYKRLLGKHTKWNRQQQQKHEKIGYFFVVVGMRSDESCSLIGVYTEIHVNSFRKIFIAFAHKPLMPECQTNLLLAMFYSYIIFVRYFVFAGFFSSISCRVSFDARLFVCSFPFRDSLVYIDALIGFLLHL